jgi:hypothetical protein
VLLAAAAAGRLKRGCAVGVITFYKAQARLEQTLQHVHGPVHLTDLSLAVWSPVTRSCSPGRLLCWGLCTAHGSVRMAGLSAGLFAKCFVEG